MEKTRREDGNSAHCSHWLPEEEVPSQVLCELVAHAVATYARKMTACNNAKILNQTCMQKQGGMYHR